MLGIGVDAFGPASLKRHNPTTSRKNTGSDYVGCLVVRRVQCRLLYQRIEGGWQGIMSGVRDELSTSGQPIPGRLEAGQGTLNP